MEENLNELKVFGELKVKRYAQDRQRIYYMPLEFQILIKIKK